ncbi:hypothetical protein R1sor_016775 [Riccia sorocarpa]|uniref:Uncharacterized protein n=1 Tax=Riccia sorocarpa TaxID=122646 RepID=A0ABD3HHV2_9MARC
MLLPLFNHVDTSKEVENHRTVYLNRHGRYMTCALLQFRVERVSPSFSPTGGTRNSDNPVNGWNCIVFAAAGSTSWNESPLSRAFGWRTVSCRGGVALGPSCALRKAGRELQGGRKRDRGIGSGIPHDEYSPGRRTNKGILESRDFLSSGVSFRKGISTGFSEFSHDGTEEHVIVRGKRETSKSTLVLFVTQGVSLIEEIDWAGTFGTSILQDIKAADGWEEVEDETQAGS